MEKKDIEEGLRALLEAVEYEPTTVDDAIETAISIKQMQKETFDESFKIYRKVSNYRRYALRLLKLTRLHLQLVSILPRILNNGSVYYIDNVVNKSSEMSQRISIDNDLVKKIKVSLDKLKKYDTIECNQDICELLVTIYLKTKMLIEEYNDYMERVETSMDGIYYMSNKNFEENAHNLEMKIEDSAIKLGLL